MPDWAGWWRSIEVRVGNPHAAATASGSRPHAEFGADLLARWPDAAAAPGDFTLELLAFAEGRFLSIHPFQDFNGRTIRLFLLELLRRLDLPTHSTKTLD